MNELLKRCQDKGLDAEIVAAVQDGMRYRGLRAAYVVQDDAVEPRATLFREADKRDMDKALTGDELDCIADAVVQVIEAQGGAL